MASRSKRILIGCGLGCGALVVLGISGCIGFSIWIGQRGELLEPERLLGRDTTGYVEWTLRLEDPGTEQFVERLIEISQTNPDEFRSPFPGWANDILAGRQNRQNAREIRQLLPLVAAWAVRPAEAPGEDLHLVTVSVVQLGNRLVFLDWILG